MNDLPAVGSHSSTLQQLQTPQSVQRLHDIVLLQECSHTEIQPPPENDPLHQLNAPSRANPNCVTEHVCVY